MAHPSTKPLHSHGFGWKPDVPDHRDFRFQLPPRLATERPPRWDMRPQMPPLYDQGEIGSCTGQGVGGAVEHLREKLGLKGDWVPSRLMIYYLEREAEGTIKYDAGAMIRTGIKVINKVGVCPEKYWTYDDTPADPVTWEFPKGAKATKKPTATAYRSSALHQTLKYQRVGQTDAEICGALASGLPVIIGFSVYESLYDPISGQPRAIIPMPGDSSDKLLGGHCVLLVGYNDGPDPMPLGGGIDLPPQHYLARNSWGDKVQAGGYFGIPYAYLRDSNLADDFWVISAIER